MPVFHLKIDGNNGEKVAFKIYTFISFACPKETNQRKRQPQIFFGLNILSVARALQLVVLRPPQTVMLTCSQRFATSKVLIYFQKRFVRHCFT
jgi:hypothetical protein